MVGTRAPFLSAPRRTVASPLSRNDAPTSHQGHVRAATVIGGIYFWGQGVAIDYPRAMALYKVGAAGGSAVCQYQVGFTYYQGRGMDTDYEQALPWLRMAAAQDGPSALGTLGAMYGAARGVTPSWRRAREYYKRAAEQDPTSMFAVQCLAEFTISVRKVTC